MTVQLLVGLSWFTRLTNPATPSCWSVLCPWTNQRADLLNSFFSAAGRGRDEWSGTTGQSFGSRLRHRWIGRFLQLSWQWGSSDCRKEPGQDSPVHCEGEKRREGSPWWRRSKLWTLKQQQAWVVGLFFYLTQVWDSLSLSLSLPVYLL